MKAMMEKVMVKEVEREGREKQGRVMKEEESLTLKVHVKCGHWCAAGLIGREK